MYKRRRLEYGSTTETMHIEIQYIKQKLEEVLNNQKSFEKILETNQQLREKVVEQDQQINYLKSQLTIQHNPVNNYYS